MGGSTVINDAVCFRIPDIVIDQWNEKGVSISKEQWDKANDEVSKRIHVSEVTEEELNTNAKKLREACEKYEIDGKSYQALVRTIETVVNHFLILIYNRV